MVTDWSESYDEEESKERNLHIQSINSDEIIGGTKSHDAVNVT
jgi:hypothetical protein